MRISDWSSDVCSSDLGAVPRAGRRGRARQVRRRAHRAAHRAAAVGVLPEDAGCRWHRRTEDPAQRAVRGARVRMAGTRARSEEHTSELQSLMRISYAVFCLKKKKTKQQ